VSTTTGVADAPTPPAPDEFSEPAWTSREKLAFRLLFTIGGGILFLSVYATSA
jgi:hypothetical protein